MREFPVLATTPPNGNSIATEFAEKCNPTKRETYIWVKAVESLSMASVLIIHLCDRFDA